MHIWETLVCIPLNLLQMHSDVWWSITIYMHAHKMISSVHPAPEHLDITCTS